MVEADVNENRIDQSKDEFSKSVSKKSKYGAEYEKQKLLFPIHNTNFLLFETIGGPKSFVLAAPNRSKQRIIRTTIWRYDFKLYSVL